MDNLRPVPGESFLWFDYKGYMHCDVYEISENPFQYGLVKDWYTQEYVLYALNNTTEYKDRH